MFSISTSALRVYWECFLCRPSWDLYRYLVYCTINVALTHRGVKCICVPICTRTKPEQSRCRYLLLPDWLPCSLCLLTYLVICIIIVRRAQCLYEHWSNVCNREHKSLNIQQLGSCQLLCVLRLATLISTQVHKYWTKITHYPPGNHHVIHL